jgi:hypothetical protein
MSGTFNAQPFNRIQFNGSGTRVVVTYFIDPRYYVDPPKREQEVFYASNFVVTGQGGYIV